MPKIAYIDKTFRADSKAIIAHANAIIAEYQGKGFDLTLRQLYYQFVSRGLLANSDKNYDRLGAIISDARLAGLVDWRAIVDRTRNIRGNSHWSEPEEILRGAARGYKIDMWATQPVRIQVWIEKDALIGVIAGVCQSLDVDYFSCRGYVSQSEMWAQAQVMLSYVNAGQRPVLLHLGDHDPSGKDMTRDIIDRLEMFMGGAKVDRLALNMSQIRQYNPPPNPTKLTDSRATGYMAEMAAQGYDPSTCWELDALDPQVISDLIRDAVLSLRDDDKWAEMEARVERERQILTSISTRYREVAKFLNGNGR